MDISLKKLIYNASHIVTGNMGIAALAFFQSIIITRSLGPSNYGTWGVILSLSGLTLAFLSFRTSDPLTKKLVEYKENKKYNLIDTLLKTSILIDFITRAVSYLIIILLAPIISLKVCGDIVYLKVYWIYGASVLFSCLDNTWYCIVRDQKRFRIIAYIPFISGLIQFTAIVALWKFKLFSIVSLAVLYLLLAVINFIFNAIYLKIIVLRVFRINISKFNFHKLIKEQENLKDFWDFMKITYISSMFTSLAKNADTIILGYFGTITQVGLYRLAKNLCSLVQQIAGALSSVIYQDFNELLIKSKFDGVKKSIKKMMIYWTPVVLIGTFMALLLGKNLILLIYGDKYAGSVDLFNILIFGSSTTVILFWGSPMILALGEYKYNLKFTSIISIASVITMLIIAPGFKAIGISVVQSLFWIMIYLGYLIKFLSLARRDIIPTTDFQHEGK